MCDDKNFAFHTLCMTLFPAADILFIYNDEFKADSNCLNQI